VLCSSWIRASSILDFRREGPRATGLDGCFQAIGNAWNIELLAGPGRKDFGMHLDQGITKAGVVQWPWTGFL